MICQLYLSMFLLFQLTLVTSAHALLIDLGNNVSYDNKSNLFWYNNLRSTYGTRYDNAKYFFENISCSFIKDNNVIVLDNFHMATRDEFISLMNNSPENIHDTFTESNIEPYEIFYVGRYDEPGPSSSEGSMHYFGGLVGLFSNTYPPQIINWIEYPVETIFDYAIGHSPIATCAWGVSRGFTPIPEPSTIFLIGIGLLLSILNFKSK